MQTATRHEPKGSINEKCATRLGSFNYTIGRDKSGEMVDIVDIHGSIKGVYPNRGREQLLYKLSVDEVME